MAAKKKKIAKRVVGLVRNKKHKPAILAARAADEVATEYSNAIPDSQLVVLAVPISAMESCAKDIFLHVPSETVVTDVGSVKGPVVYALEKIFARKGKFVGSHPMAGSEKSGIDAARGNLFEKALCILTPTPSTDPEALRLVGKFWQQMGCKTCLCSAHDHDRLMATVSHVPHLLAACLMRTTRKAGEGFEDPIRFAGPSFRDMTRIAASPPELWADIVLANRNAILRAATVYVEQLEGVKELLEKHDREALLAFFRDSQAQREKL